MASGVQPRRSRRARRARHNAAAVAASAILLPLIPPGAPDTQRASILLAYASLGFLLVTLSIGPRNVLQGRRNPVSNDLRRDLGIWAGLTGVGHVVFSFQHHFGIGGDVLKYFFTSGRFAPGDVRRGPFGVAIYVGVAATLVLVVLVALSNDRALRRLGRRWKTLQRANLRAWSAGGRAHHDLLGGLGSHAPRCRARHRSRRRGHPPPVARRRQVPPPPSRGRSRTHVRAGRQGRAACQEVKVVTVFW